jgi:UPF0271 protein
LVIARSGGAVAIAARRAGVPVWQEVFADRAYRQDGTLVPRSDPGALLASPSAVVARLERLSRNHAVETDFSCGLAGERRAIFYCIAVG